MFFALGYYSILYSTTYLLADRSCLRTYSCCCVQTDKASMLDEAIEYLKSLQLQVQVSETVTD